MGLNIPCWHLVQTLVDDPKALTHLFHTTQVPDHVCAYVHVLCYVHVYIRAHQKMLVLTVNVQPRQRKYMHYTIHKPITHTEHSATSNYGTTSNYSALLLIIALQMHYF